MNMVNHDFIKNSWLFRMQPVSSALNYFCFRVGELTFDTTLMFRKNIIRITANDKQCPTFINALVIMPISYCIVAID